MMYIQRSFRGKVAVKVRLHDMRARAFEANVREE